MQSLLCELRIQIPNFPSQISHPLIPRVLLGLCKIIEFDGIFSNVLRQLLELLSEIHSGRLRVFHARLLPGLNLIAG